MEADALAMQYFEIDPATGEITVRSNLEFGTGGSTLTFRVNLFLDIAVYFRQGK